MTNMIRFANCYLLLLFLIIVASAPAQATEGQKQETNGSDVLTPQKGHPLFGTFHNATNQEVVFETDSGPTVTFKWADVKELEIAHRTTIRAKKPLTSSSALKSVDLDTVTIQPDQGNFAIVSSEQKFSVPQVDLDSISPPTGGSAATTGTVLWTGSATGKATLVSGTQTQQTVGAQIYIRRNQNPNAIDWQHETTTLILEANNSLTEQVGTTSIRTHTYDGSLTHQVYLWRGLFLDGLAEGYHNSSLNLYLQQSYGGGLGRNLYKDDRNTLEAGADFLYIAEHFYSGVPSVSFAGVRLHEGYTFSIAYIHDTPLVLAETASYTPAFNQKKAWQARGGVTLSVPMTKTLSATLAFNDNYLENAPNARKNYATSSIGLTYTFPTPK
jgi:Protein of unknown function, DUF481